MHGRTSARMAPGVGLASTEQMADEKDGLDRELTKEDMVWTRIYYGREVMEQILDTIQVKHALRQRFMLRYALRAAMAGVVVCLLYVFAYQVKADLGPGFNDSLSKYLTAL